MTAGSLCILPGALLLMLATPLAAREPIAIRDQNPLIRGLYLPVPGDDLPAAGALVQRFVLTVSNTTNIERGAGETLRVDGESLELRWLLAWQPLERVEIRFTVPVVHYGGGALDGLVEGWHDLFGVSTGSRSAVPGNDLSYGYWTAGDIVWETEGGTSLGDSALEAGLKLRETNRTELSAWIGVEAPTGNGERLTGNDAWDAGLWLEGSVSLSERASLEARAGVVRPGSAAPLPLEPRDWVAFGSVGASWAVAPALALRLQLDAHDGMFEDTDLRFLGEALLLTLGAQYRSAGGWRWQFALAEDVLVNASPDFAIHLSLQIGASGAR